MANDVFRAPDSLALRLPLIIIMPPIRFALAQTSPVSAPSGPPKLEKPHSTTPFPTIDVNLAKAKQWVIRAKEGNADVVVFPEYFLQGIVNEGRQVSLPSTAPRLRGPVGADRGSSITSSAYISTSPSRANTSPPPCKISPANTTSPYRERSSTGPCLLRRSQPPSLRPHHSP